MNDLVKIENNQIVIEPNSLEKLKMFYKLKEEVDLIEKSLKQQSKEKMEELGIKKAILPGLCMTIKNATTRTTLDSKRLKEELPDVYEEYSKTSEVASSITFTFAD